VRNGGEENGRCGEVGAEGLVLALTAGGPLEGEGQEGRDVREDRYGEGVSPVEPAECEPDRDAGGDVSQAQAGGRGCVE
jgi:hypothetical protein